ncbi:ribonuclease HI [Megasphaera sp.]|uniref:ribonuclease HI n=1 Tax=Megasphaera sp. TaxID=2023260 RepID=UPI003520643D
MQKKIYAVRRGRTTGLFLSWADCQKQVDGFPGARFKSFTDATEAWKWLNGKETAAPKRTGAPKKSRQTAKTAAPSQPLRPDEEQDFVIYTDGSCLRNPDGPGGWAVVACNVATGEVTELCDGNPSTTNNRMELLAAIMALRFAPEGTKVALYTDSQYLKNGITKWVAGWKRRGWKKADGQPVLNQAYWVELDKLYAAHDVTFHWVKGHVGVELNERCDQLAKAQAVKYK